MAWLLLISPQNARTAALHDQTAAATARLPALQRRLAELQRQNADKQQYLAQLDQDRQALPSTSGMSDFLRELQAAKTEYALAQLARAGLAQYVEFRVGDALASLGQLAGPFDFVLIDLWKNLYVPVFELLHPKLAQGAIIVADNMLQPESARAHARAYRQRVGAAADMSSVLLAVGNGLEVSRYQ